MADVAATVEQLRAELQELRALLAESHADNASLRAENTALAVESAEGIEQQTAMVDILQQIVASPGDADAVLTTIAEHATRIGRAVDTQIFRRDDDQVCYAGHFGALGAADSFRRPWPLHERRFINEVIRQGRAIEAADIGAEAEEKYPDTFANALRAGMVTAHRTWLGVPLKVGAKVIGALTLRRATVAPFLAREIAVTEAFAAEAALAIENARLFEELHKSNTDLTDALERQTATADVLKIIASSPTQLQHVLSTLSGTAARLCGAEHAVVQVPNGDVLRVVASVFATEEAARHWADGDAHFRAEGLPTPPIMLEPERIAGRAALERRTIYVANLADAAEFPASREIFEVRGVRSQVTAPLIRGSELIGVFTLHARRMDAFSPSQVAQLETFADQAVIAIENARLFQELEQRNQELQESNRQVSEALEQQTALGEVLRVIASSPTDLQTVIDTIAATASRLCGSDFAAVMRRADDYLVSMAMHAQPGIEAAIQTLHEMKASSLQSQGQPGVPLTRGSASWVALLDRATVHIEDTFVVEGTYPQVYAASQRFGHRTFAATPLLHGGEALGVLTLSNFGEPRPFTDRQIRLLEMFADQAVIAMANTRLFDELAQRNRDLNEALEQQTATAEVLRVIAGAPTDLHRVLQAIIDAAAHLCDASHANLVQFRESDRRLAPLANHGDQDAQHLMQGVPVSRGSVAGRAFLERRTVHVPDVLSVLETEYPDAREFTAATSTRAIVCVPLLRHGEPIGVLTMRRLESRPFTDQQISLLETFADQAVIAMENARLFSELEQRNAELTGALDRQTATADILRVIASSPTDLDRVLNAVAESAARLCNANNAMIFRVQDDRYVPVTRIGSMPVLAQPTPLPIDPGSIPGRAMIEGRTVHVPDVEAVSDQEFPLTATISRSNGTKSALATPLIREGAAIGAIYIRRAVRHPFTGEQIALMEAFADQAVIAIENAGLFQELQLRTTQLTEALTQQTVLAEVLRVIASSPTDLRSVLQSVVESAARLCAADNVGIWRADGELMERMVNSSSGRGPLPGTRTPLDRGMPSGRVILDGQTIHILDLESVRKTEFPTARLAITPERVFTPHSYLAVPLMREGVTIGAMSVERAEVRAFTGTEIALMETFADQAVIAIENARLFSELEQRTADLTQSLEQQTALGEVLRVIASSPTDAQRVLDTIADSARRLCNADGTHITRLHGNMLHVAARSSASVEERGPRLGRTYPLTRTTPPGRAILERRLIQVEDVDSDETRAEFPDLVVFGAKTTVSAPLIRDGVAIGTIGIAREEARPFSPGEVTLLQTFADQAVIAIENARLFADLRESLEQQTVTAEVLRVIASSPTDKTKVLEAISWAAARLTESDGASVLQLVGDRLKSVAEYGSEAAAMDLWRAATQETGSTNARPLTARTVVTTAFRERRTIHVPDMDIAVEHEYPDSRAHHSAMGHRSQVVTPLLREGEPIGILVVQNYSLRPFTEQQIALIEAFANQAVIAIENTRLFEELEERTRALTQALERQTATSEILRTIAGAPNDLDAVFETVARNAARVCGADDTVIHRVVNGCNYVVAHHGPIRSSADAREPRPVNRDGVVGRVVLDRQTIHILDAATVSEDDLPTLLHRHRQSGQRTTLATPMLRQGEAIGSIMIRRLHVEAFTENQIAALEAFASQAVIAIENARLFEELQESTARLKRSVDELEALGQVSQAVSSSLDLQEVLTTILTHAVELSMSDGGTVYALEDETGRFRLRAANGMSQALASAFDTNDQAGLTSPIVERVMAARAPVSIPSILEDDGLIERGPDDPVRVVLQREGFKSVLGLPLLREQQVVGALVIRRKTAGEFPPSVVELLQTFANQSVLAIQNARLFQEVEAKSRELAVASQHKSQFLANMSHELRTPLNAVIGYSEMLQEELDDLGQDALVPDVEKINAAGRHLLGLINDILDLSKIEAGKMELFIEPVDVAALVHDVAATVGPLIAKNGNQLQVEVAADIRDMQADATKLRQILFNLLGNAAKFTDRGAITLTVGRESADWVVFSVADTGIGMTEEQLGRLFQAFTQAEASTTRSFGGTGLGLTLVRHFAELMSGEVTVSSTPGTGSIFTVRLPSVVTTPEQRAHERELPALDGADGTLPDPSRLNAPVVLVIDDDATSRELLRRHLEADGVHAVEAASGEDGLRLARQLQPSLITLDVLMPGMDGWAVLGALKGDPATAEIPVILLTILDDRDLGYALGAADYLTKPIDRDRLLRAVSKHVRHDERGRTRRALIVEDDPATRDMLRRLLKREGWSIEEAANGRIGLELVTAAPPDLILLDLMMPELDGFGFVERLRAEPAWRTIPVLVITAKDLTVQERLRLNGWVEQVLQKGAYSRSDLLAEVRALVRASVEQP